MKLPKTVPKKFRKFFWDVDAKKLNPSKKPYFVIQRLLDKGDEESVRWVRDNFGDELIRTTFNKLHDFRPKVGNFWKLFLNIPSGEILCLQKHYLQMRSKHWPY